MKKIFISFLQPLFLFMIVGVFITSCNVSKGSKKPIDRTQNETQVIVDEDKLVDYTWGNLLRRVPGVIVGGSEPDLSIIIRGAKTMQGTNQPLFILDGVPLGNSFGDLARQILPQNVNSIRVLSGPELARYGNRGVFGVIEVKSKE